MVGKNHHGKVFAAFHEIVVDRCQNQAVDLFNAEHLVVGFRAVTAFVGSLHMDVDKIVSVPERPDGGFRFARIIGVDISGRALHVNGMHSGADADALD